MSNRKVVLITGSAGFIGSHIADVFIHKKYEVIGIDNLKSGNVANVNPKVKFFNIDLDDSKSVEEILKKYKPYFLIHHASNLVNVVESIRFPREAQKDIYMTIQLIEIAQKNGLGHVIFPSSANVYGNQPRVPINEGSPLHPLSPYGVAKVTIEKYLQDFSQTFGIPVCIFRYFNVYGPRQSLKYRPVIPTFISQLLAHKQIHVYGGDQTRDFVFVTDVARANYIAAEKKVAGVYNIGSGSQVQIKQLLQILEILTQEKARITYSTKTKSDYDSSQASIGKALVEFSWKPYVDFAEGLKHTINFYSLKNTVKDPIKKLKKNFSPAVNV